MDSLVGIWIMKLVCGISELDGDKFGANVKKYIKVRPVNRGKDSKGNLCPKNP